MQIEAVPIDQFEREAARLGVSLPIEQTAVWASYQATIEGRSPWASVLVKRDGATVALASLFDYATHGYHYLRSTHGPVWVAPPAPADEAEALEALLAFVRKRDHKVVFMRLGVTAELPATQPVLSITPYDSTVIMDITGTDDDIIARMKARGRRDVRKALRESPATYADETALARASFDEYYDVMRETGARDGFTPSPQRDYEDMLAILGPEHCRLFAGRVDGAVVSWTIATVNDGHAVRYYGASRSDVPKRSFVTDGLIYFEACTLSREGVTTYDMMGIGSDAFPGLSTLNTFKCKFAPEATSVAPDRDVPVKRVFYRSLQLMRAQLQKRRARKAAARGASDGSPQ